MVGKTAAGLAEAAAPTVLQPEIGPGVVVALGACLPALLPETPFRNRVERVGLSIAQK